MISMEILIPELEKRLYIKADLSEKARTIFQTIKEVVGENLNELEWEMIATDSYRKFNGDLSLEDIGAVCGETLLVLRR